MFTVEVPPGAIADLINSGIARLPPDHPIKTVRYLPTEGGGCFVAVNSNRQIYFRQWREYIAPLLGEQYVSMLTVSVQNAYKCHVNAKSGYSKCQMFAHACTPHSTGNFVLFRA